MPRVASHRDGAAARLRARLRFVLVVEPGLEGVAVPPLAVAGGRLRTLKARLE